MSLSNPHITLIGCGKMGSAMLAGWQAANLPASYSVIDPHDQIHGVECFHSAAAAKNALAKTDILFLAIKPQIMSDICAALKPYISAETLVISIAAGQTIANYESYFSAAQPIIRTMPNTPAAIGKGMIVGIGNDACKGEHINAATPLLTAAGKLEWITDEGLMDTVTAISGSGPAYIFYLIEALAKAGHKAGLDQDTATILARQTVIGSAALAESEPNTPAETLRKNVTSPSGTTEAALKILMNGEFDECLHKAVNAAITRGQELAKK